jgi:hypothetical protein
MEAAEKQLMRRCPRLGGPVSFHYCRTCEPGQQLCWKIIDCWWETFDVVRYLQERLTPEQLKRLQNSRGGSKITRIIENIKHAKSKAVDKDLNSSK